ncbi:MAG: hypothetical protein PUI06_05095 [Prevotella sp.]|nr:hypothetical protein [Prevotella sp.]MDY5665928.1 hypothetical protein [Alloprevotella sp.]
MIVRLVIRFVPLHRENEASNNMGTHSTMQPCKSFTPNSINQHKNAAAHASHGHSGQINSTHKAHFSLQKWKS